MPFDSLPMIEPAEVAATVFRERRERAVALWRTIPRQRFSMMDWVSTDFEWDCNTRACALGWLAHHGHDGWSFRNFVPCSPCGHSGFYAAQTYFGLTVENACACFGYGASTARLHSRKYLSRVTPRDVGHTLLALPYASPDPVWDRIMAMPEMGG